MAVERLITFSVVNDVLSPAGPRVRLIPYYSTEAAGMVREGCGLKIEVE